ncbi:MAG TPA: argininosuccinate lyase, partial [Acidimicrobiales bacterium]
GVHLSRVGEEIALWSSEEFGFVKLADAYATGSSMLPQKKNPDIAELARGKAGRLIGNLTGLLTTLKGLPLDPDFTAAELGFAGRFENSLDAVSDRDFVAEALFALSLVAIHLSRMGEEVILWSTDEFGFARLDDAYSTGSSMMPQKKNPDIAELARGKSGRVIGNLTGLLASLKGLPLSYNRDLQEDKEPLFDAVEQVSRALAAMTGLYATLTFELERMQAAADSPYAAATDLAELLVERGVPFRDAHALVGALVRDSLERHVPLAELVEAHPDLGADGAALLEPGLAVTRRTTPGGGGPDAVAVQLDRYARRLDADAARIG